MKRKLVLALVFFLATLGTRSSPEILGTINSDKKWSGVDSDGTPFVAYGGQIKATDGGTYRVTSSTHGEGKIATRV